MAFITQHLNSLVSRSILLRGVVVLALLQSPGCKEPLTQDRVAEDSVVFEFSHCLDPQTNPEMDRRCVDTLMGTVNTDIGRGCLVVEVGSGTARQTAPFTFERTGVTFEKDARLVLRSGQMIRSAAFFLGDGESADPCGAIGALGVDDPCTDKCVFKMKDVGGPIARGQNIKFLGEGGECDVSWRAGSEPDEFCDEIDNDCDGLADEGIATDTADGCSVGIGRCAREGQYSCGEDGRIVCDAIPGSPQAETQDGTDEDCDGRIDEGLNMQCSAPGMTEPCPNIVALNERCAMGVRFCQEDGSWGICVDASGEPLIVDEICDGLDNDCDGDRDEDFGGRGDIYEGAECATGSGSCRSEGMWVCGAEELLCNAPAIVPEEEVCDQQDNDCDGRSDEAAPQVPLTRPCFSGGDEFANVGVCNLGTETCIDGAYGACSGDTLPSEEVCEPVGRDEDCDGEVDESGQNACGFCGPLPVEDCNGADDDCDGSIDEDFELTEVTSCGSCDVDCTDGPENAVMGCVGQQCVVAACDLGFQDRDRDPSNGCECNGAAVDEPDPDFIDSDCDGLDGTLGDAIFVHPNGNDNEVGSADQPMRTIEAAILLARRLRPQFDRIYVSEGSFRLSEFVEVNGQRVRFELPDGFRIHGGFRRGGVGGQEWSRHPLEEARTIIYGSQVALRVSNLTMHTMLDNLELRANDSAQATPSSSVGVFAKNVGPHLHLRDVLIRAGRGGDGVDGTDGVNANQWANRGGNGQRREGGSGGRAMLCEGGVLSAGSGGDGGLPGRNGESGGVPLDAVPEAAGGVAVEDDDEARNGEDGPVGMSGENGVHGRADGEIQEDGLWVPLAGTDGLPGIPGGGGGGGAGLFDDQVAECVAGGGGGGGGGCPGTLGTAGTGGYGSIGLLVTGGAVRLENVQIVADDAGDGGDGARGGQGRSGGDGGVGAAYPNNCNRAGLRAGRGGGGGAGGCGGHGGGAGGGPSVAVLRVAPRLGAMANSAVIFTNSQGEPLADQAAAAQEQLQFASSGDAGVGGSGNDCEPEAPSGLVGVARRIGCCHAGPAGGPCGGRGGEELTCDVQ